MIRYIIALIRADGSRWYYRVNDEGDRQTAVIERAALFTLAEVPLGLSAAMRTGLGVRLLRVRVWSGPEFVPVHDPENYRYIDKNGRISSCEPPGIARRRPTTDPVITIINDEE
jgi:hypothetical protein